MFSDSRNVLGTFLARPAQVPRHPKDWANCCSQEGVQKRGPTPQEPRGEEGSAESDKDKASWPLSSISRKVSKSCQEKKMGRAFQIQGEYVQRPRSLSKLERFGAWEVSHMPLGSGTC